MTTRVGISGTGFIGKGLLTALRVHEDLKVTCVLTRSNADSRPDYPSRELLTHSVAELVDTSDVIVECSGDVLHSTVVIDTALRAGLPVVTMNAEMHVTTGSYFVGHGLLSEAEGDQPGCLAALKEDAVQMGFQPIVYGNIKGFLNHNPTPEDMTYWAEKQGISMTSVVSFTDGTKLQIEQALAANGLGAIIAAEGLTGMKVTAVSEAVEVLAALSESAGCPIADYVLSSASTGGIFIIATHAQYTAQRQYLANYKLGDGPYYLLLKNYHLCHLEVPKTIKRIIRGDGVLLDNSACPRVGVAAVAKRPLQPGERIRRGIGSFDVRGVAVRIAECPEHCPIGLLDEAVVVRRVDANQMLSMGDVELPESLALNAWLSVRRRVLARTGGAGV
ncbi:MAG: NAD(P)-dependent oxidoreductase [Dehalococcoidia bacterium]|nr:NAD(P)-dependent oxidoreductase [Dehalococcoidia bacterium]